MTLLRLYIRRLNCQTFLGKTSRTRWRSNLFTSFAFIPSNLNKIMEMTSKLKITFTHFCSNFSLLTHSLRIKFTFLTLLSELSKITNREITMITPEVEEVAGVMIKEEGIFNRINREKNAQTSF